MEVFKLALILFGLSVERNLVSVEADDSDKPAFGTCNSGCELCVGREAMKLSKQRFGYVLQQT